jgi:cation:H+ antiporter
VPPLSLTPDAVLFGLGAAVALGASAVLARRLEHLGVGLGLSEAGLGLVTALAADSPEIASSVTALQRGQHAVGVGVVLGSNVFNLAWLLGLGALASGQIALHRRVVVLEGAVACVMVASALLVVSGSLPVGGALALALVGFAPYALVVSLRPRTLGRSCRQRRALAWLTLAVREEGAELGPLPVAGPGRRGLQADLGAVAFCLAAVVAASALMERTGTVVGAPLGAPPIVVGGVLLAAVTSLPNAVSAVYLARRGRGAAVLSEAMNSNGLNVIAGLLLPGAVVGLGAVGSGASEVAWWYAALTVASLAIAACRRGLGRLFGIGIVLAYVVFVLSLVA